jgi:hypothetical protein
MPLCSHKSPCKRVYFNTVPLFALAFCFVFVAVKRVLKEASELREATGLYLRVIFF